MKASILIIPSRKALNLKTNAKYLSSKRESNNNMGIGGMQVINRTTEHRANRDIQRRGKGTQSFRITSPLIWERISLRIFKGKMSNALMKRSSNRGRSLSHYRLMRFPLHQFRPSSRR